MVVIGLFFYLVFCRRLGACIVGYVFERVVYLLTPYQLEEVEPLLYAFILKIIIKAA